MKGWTIRINDEVAHIANLGLKLIVEDLKWRRVMEHTGRVDDKGRAIKVPRRHFDGAVCIWWQENELRRRKFHSGQLVPWAIAMNGKEKAEQFIEELRQHSREIR